MPGPFLPLLEALWATWRTAAPSEDKQIWKGPGRDGSVEWSSPPSRLAPGRNQPFLTPANGSCSQPEGSRHSHGLPSPAASPSFVSTRLLTSPWAHPRASSTQHLAELRPAAPRPSLSAHPYLLGCHAPGTSDVSAVPFQGPLRALIPVLVPDTLVSPNSWVITGKRARLAFWMQSLVSWVSGLKEVLCAQTSSQAFPHGWTLSMLHGWLNADIGGPLLCS